MASPYSHPDENVRLRRFEQACKAASELMATGEAVFCPIAHSHSIHVQAPLPETFEFWMAMDKPILQHCTRMVVLMLDGWQTSKGVSEEIRTAEAMGIPIEYMPHEVQRHPIYEGIYDDE